MKIRLRFLEVDQIDEKVFTNFLDHINQDLTVHEIQAVRSIRENFPEVPQVAVDAALFRLVNGERTRSATRIEAVDRGSVTVIIAGTALAYWVLDKTVGETLKDAWKESGLHRRIRRFLLAGQADKMKNSIRDSSTATAKTYRYEELYTRIVSVRENLSDEQQPYLDVDVQVVRTEEEPPSYGKLADDHNEDA